ncbi:hypothetical protein [Natranaeroarchaeum sulfidigenes]|uniref:hypothetical protein n=1 Tax=Natranaeroarchaeum sulfidigenes TaxID=2784880 RepID=UPI001EE62360|nr:hypothetical protein [Natranaeroarchaeum sulfidigenes]
MILASENVWQGPGLLDHVVGVSDVVKREVSETTVISVFQDVLERTIRLSALDRPIRSSVRRYYLVMTERALFLG